MSCNTGVAHGSLGLRRVTATNTEYDMLMGFQCISHVNKHEV